MKRIKLFTAALLLAAISAGNGVGAFRFKKERHASGRITQILQWKRQPVVGFHFVADPTSVEYNGRLYVYGTNDTQQLDSVGKDGKNTYQYIPFTGHAVHR